MADSEPRRGAGRALAHDLLAIRKDRKIELKEVLDKTRLADDVIEQLEDSGLIDNPMFNRVYLRSMFSAYGDVLGIERSDMMDALESAMKGVYDGRLGRKYLGDVQTGAAPPTSSVMAGRDDPSDRTDTPPPSDSAKPPDSAQPSGSARPPDSAKPSGSAKPPDSTKLPDSAKPPDSTKPPDLASRGDSSEPPRPPGTSRSLEPPEAPRPPSPESRSDTPGAEPGKFSMSSSEGPIPERSTRVLLPNMNGFIVLLVLALLLIIFAWYAIARWTGGPEAQTVEPAAVEFSQTETTVETEPIVLPDSFVVRVLAMADIMDPVRVAVDQDLTRPYWIDRFDSLKFTGLRRVPIREGVTGLQYGHDIMGDPLFMAFEFLVSDRIVLERKLDEAMILVDEFRAPQEWLPATGSLTLSRQRLQSWLDSLSAAGGQPATPASHIREPILQAQPASLP